jgi:uncharacterized membrane protein
MKRFWIYALLVAALMAAGLGLRVRGIASRPLWFDEASDWKTSARSTGIEYQQFFLWTNDFEAAPFTFLLRRVTMDALGSEAEWVQRLPALTCGVLCIPMAFWLGKLTWSPGLGLWAAAIVTFDPDMVDQAQQARSYPMFMLLILAGLASAIVLLHDPPRSVARYFGWAGLGAVMGLAFCTTQFGLALWCGVFLAGVPAVVAGATLGRAPRAAAGKASGLAVAYGVAIAIASVGLYRLWTRDTNRNWGAAMTYPAIAREIIVAAKDLIALGPAGLLMYILAAIGLAVLSLRRRVAALLPLCLTLATVAMLFAFRKQHHFLAPRYLMPVQPALWLGVGALAFIPRQRWLRSVGLAAAVILLACGIWYATDLNRWYTGSDSGKWLVGPQLVRLAGHKGPRDAVVYQPVVLGTVGKYYHLDTPPQLNYGLYDVPLRPNDIGTYIWDNRANPRVPDGFDAPVTWLLAGMLDYDPHQTGPRPDHPTRYDKAVAIIDALAAHYGVPVDPGQLAHHLHPHRVLVLRFSRSGIVWQSRGVGEPDTILVGQDAR